MRNRGLWMLVIIAIAVLVFSWVGVVGWTYVICQVFGWSYSIANGTIVWIIVMILSILYGYIKIVD